MAEYTINKGIGKPIEFKGLISQYLFIFTGGLLAEFILFVIMYLIGIDQMVCWGFGIVTTPILIWLTFRLNDKYGEFGLMKQVALKTHPRYIINRLRVRRLLKRIKSLKDEKYT